MSARSVSEIGWEPNPTPDCLDQARHIEGILKRLADSFTEVNIAADFLQMRRDPASEGPDLQLACLIKERIAGIQEQVTELYFALNRLPLPALRQ